MGYSDSVAVVYLGLGSNLGDRAAMLGAARRRLDDLGSVKAVSSIYETAPWGVADQPSFLNQCCRLETDLAPLPLLRTLKRIEHDLGRVRNTRWGPRVIDLDLLAYDDLVLRDEEISIPHPGIADRAFVLVPLAELAPDLVLPGLDASVKELLARLSDAGSLIGVWPMPA